MSDQKSTQTSHDRASTTAAPATAETTGGDDRQRGSDTLRGTIALNGGLAFTLVTLAVLSAGRVGLWEPWETRAAELGAALHTGDLSLTRPLIEGEVFARAWLEPALLQLGAALGGGELAYRLPFAMLMGLALFAVGMAVSAHFGRLRGALALIFCAATPMVALSTTSLAGDAALIATTGIAAMSIAGALRWRGTLAWGMAGAALGLSFLSGALHGIGPILIAAAIASTASASAPAEGWLRTRGAAFWIAVALVISGVTLPLVALLTAGGDAALRWLAAGLLFDFPLAALLFSARYSSFHSLTRPRNLMAFVGMLSLIALPLLLLTWKSVGGAELLSFVLRHDLLNADAEARTTFDVLIRLAGFSAYPLTALLPLGAAWALSRRERDSESREELYGGAFGLVLIGWMAASILVIGVSSNFTGLQAMPVAIPIAILGALALSDREWVRAMKPERASLYAATLAGVMILVVMSKDVMGQFDEDAGRPGPRVIFEFLLQDGDLPFPADYAFVNMRLIVVAWLLLFVGLGALVVATTSGSPSGAVSAWRERLQAAGRLRWARTALRGLLRPVATFLRIAERPRVPALLLAAFATSLMLWSVLLVGRYIPDIAPHVSNRALVSAWERYADEGELLYTAQLEEDEARYYLGDRVEESFRMATMLRTPFCSGDEREFAIVPTEELAQTRHAVLSYASCEDGDNGFHVLYSESARFALVSNQLETEAGERDDSVFATHVITSLDELPESATRFERPHTFNGDLRLVAASIDPTEISGSGEFVVRTWWEVVDRVTGDYEMFIHADTPRNRINGDHDPVFGKFSTRYWLEGDIVLDEHTMEASRFGDRRGVYDVHVGFFRGDNRMSVSPTVSEDRVKVGTVTLR